MDIQLNTITHDFELINGAIVLTKEDEAEVAQRVRIRLNTRFGEWFLDTGAGVPYTNTSKTQDVARILADYVRAVIISTTGVADVSNYTFNFNQGARTMSIKTDIIPVDGYLGTPIPFTFEVF